MSRKVQELIATVWIKLTQETSKTKLLSLNTKTSTTAQKGQGFGCLHEFTNNYDQLFHLQNFFLLSNEAEIDIQGNDELVT